MPPISAGQAIVNVLKAEGVKAVFGIPGGHTLPIYDALYDTPEIRHILVRHEQVAANMAAGYAQLTGEPGVCCVTAGPGATNLVSGIAEAFVGALPIIILAGRGATTTTHKGASQEIAQEQLFRPITKWAVRIDRGDLVTDVLRRAFTVARSGKPGPVLLDLPRDILAQPVPPAPPYRPVGRSPPTRASADAIEAAAGLLRRAERPLLVAGGGVIASGAWNEVCALAELLQAPVITTLSGRGSMPDDHPLAAGGIGHHRTWLTRRLLPEADVVLGLGCRFEEQETNWRPDFLPGPEARYIQVDIDAGEIGRSIAPSVGVVGDARQVLIDLVLALKEQGPPRSVASKSKPRLQQLARDKEKLDAGAAELTGSNQRPIHPLRVIREVREAFPRETTVAIDVGVLAQGMAGAFPYFKVFEPRSTIVPSSFYGMGFAASALPAAKLAHPDRPAVGFVGDGSFQMVMNVLPVAAEYRLPVTWCVLNDRALGSIWDGQRANFGNRIIATTFEVQPDFAAIARACQCHGERVEDPADIRPALERALAANANGVPALIDFIVARERVAGSIDFFAKR
jgi:acetolactate synthase-1/2/3 large subunit